MRRAANLGEIIMKVASFFAGVDGIDLGFEKAGFDSNGNKKAYPS